MIHLLTPLQVGNLLGNAIAVCHVRVLLVMEKNGITEPYNHTSLSQTHFKKMKIPRLQTTLSFTQMQAIFRTPQSTDAQTADTPSSAVPTGMTNE